MKYKEYSYPSIKVEFYEKRIRLSISDINNVSFEQEKLFSSRIISMNILYDPQQCEWRNGKEKRGSEFRKRQFHISKSSCSRILSGASFTFHYSQSRKNRRFCPNVGIIIRSETPLERNCVVTRIFDLSI